MCFTQGNILQMMNMHTYTLKTVQCVYLCNKQCKFYQHIFQHSTDSFQHIKHTKKLLVVFQQFINNFFNELFVL